MVQNRFNIGDWVQIEDRALGLKAIGVVLGICNDWNNNRYYSVEWKVMECTKTKGIQPASLYPVESFDQKGILAPTAQVLYGKP